MPGSRGFPALASNLDRHARVTLESDAMHHAGGLPHVNTPVVCRKATPHERHAIWNVRTASIKALCKSHYGEETAEAWANVPPPDDFEDVIRSHDFLVAENDTVLVGFGFLNQRTATLEAIFVAPEFARRGIGTAVLAALEEIARGAGLSRLGLSASLNAVGFYAQAGYQAIEPTIWPHPAGFDLPCVAMAKDLSRPFPNPPAQTKREA
ncbi:MAG TPA: GNAT family N-acetyltransferase [Pirellulales bacterium]|nr:GNAT family N-acetyltransferase [Pirellulales bacterium]